MVVAHRIVEEFFSEVHGKRVVEKFFPTGHELLSKSFFGRVVEKFFGVSLNFWWSTWGTGVS